MASGDDERVGFCKACRRPLIWALTSTRKWMPLDFRPVVDGNFIIVERVLIDGHEGTVPKIASVSKGQDVGGEPRYQSHWASCPRAKDFRKAKK